MSELDAMLAIAGAAVDEAQRTIRATPIGVVTAKGDRDMATEVDYAVEQALRGFLASGERGASCGRSIRSTA